MSVSLEDNGAFESDEGDAGELFMLTFGAVGVLALLDADPAAASPTPAIAPLTPEEAQALLGGVPAAAIAALALPAGGDSAFVAAVVALNPPSADGPAPPASIASQVGAGNDLAAPDAVFSLPQGDFYADDALGSSTSPGVIGALGPAEIFVRGDDLVVALAAGVKLTIGGANDFVLTSADDTIEVLSGSSVAVSGAGAKVTLGSQDNLTLTGVGFEVHASGGDDIVTVQAASQATIYGDGIVTQIAAPNASATVIGAANSITLAAPGGSVTVGSEGAASGDFSQANAVYMQSGGAVNLMDMSTLAAHGAGAAYLGANDFLALFGAFDIYAPQLTGASVISAFGGDDTLHLNAAFGDVAALLGAAIQNNGATTLYLNGTGDSLTLTGLDMTQVSAYAHDGHIRLN